MLTGSLLLTTARERLRGFRQALRRWQVPLDPALVREGHFHIDSGFELAYQLLRGSDPPTALFVSNGLMAAGALKAIGALGLRCPQDVALATFDDPPLNEIASPPLTSIAQPAYMIGYRGSLTLLSRIKSKKPGEPCRIRLRAELNIRQSTVGRTHLSVESRCI